MNDPNQPQPPYLDSERHFRRYENYVRSIVAMWPEAVTFKLTPPIASVETLSSRIRICIKSLRNHQWDVNFNMAKFIQICDEVVVSTTAKPGCVVCGPYDVIRKLVPLDVIVETNSTTAVMSSVNLDEPSIDLIDAVVILHHYQILLEPSIIKTNRDLKFYQEKYDVVIEREGDVWKIL